MIYKLIYTEKAFRQLQKLERPNQGRIKSALEIVRISPFTHATKLLGESHYKLRVGDFRIILDITTTNTLTILIIKAGHRRNIYGRQ
jgi:mRNA-degrading endonuclease RelE of RelBE toxin-antitoxin system